MIWRTARAFLSAFLLCVIGAGLSRGADASQRDALIYKDGDRVQGKFIERTDDVIVFRSERFGELRVAASDAVVIMAERAVEPVKASAPGIAAAPGAAVKPGGHTTEEERLKIWEWFSPFVLTAKVRNFFGPWHGRFAFSTEVVSDASDRSNISLDGHMQRKWKSDEVQLNARYDYSQTNQLATTDTVRASGYYRHDFSSARFALYRPAIEWNQANVQGSNSNDYVLLQQEVGVGFNLISTPTKKVRAGVSENVFDLWNTKPTKQHTSRTVESIFEEAELTLPWRMSLSQRGVWYVPLNARANGWENRIELNKKLTETLSLAVRHEIRRNNPDGSSQDYTRLRLLLGLDF